MPNAKARAEGLYYQANFDERVEEARARIQLFAAAVDQVSFYRSAVVEGLLGLKS